MGSGSPWQTQDGQDLLLHLLLFAAAEPSEAGVNQGLGLLAPQGETEQEQQGQQEQGPGMEERLVGSGGGSGLEGAAATFAHVLLFHLAKTREAVGDVHDCGLLLFFDSTGKLRSLI